MIVSNLHINIFSVAIMFFSYGCTRDINLHSNNSSTIKNQTSDTYKNPASVNKVEFCYQAAAVNQLAKGKQKKDTKKREYAKWEKNDLSVYSHFSLNDIKNRSSALVDALEESSGINISFQSQRDADIEILLYSYNEPSEKYTSLVDINFQKNNPSCGYDFASGRYAEYNPLASLCLHRESKQLRESLYNGGAYFYLSEQDFNFPPGMSGNVIGVNFVNMEEPLKEVKSIDKFGVELHESLGGIFKTFCLIPFPLSEKFLEASFQECLVRSFGFPSSKELSENAGYLSKFAHGNLRRDFVASSGNFNNDLECVKDLYSESSEILKNFRR